MVIKGGYNDEGGPSFNEGELLSKTVTLNTPFTIHDNDNSVSGTISRAEGEMLHFKGDVQVGPASAAYDKDMNLGIGYHSEPIDSYGNVYFFYIQIEKYGIGVQAEQAGPAYPPQSVGSADPWRWT